MDWIFLEIKQQNFKSPLQPPYFLLPQPPPPPPVNLQHGGFNLNNKVSPSILLILVILAIIFFLSGLLHLLVRFLVRPLNRDPDEVDTVTVLQGQLQQLFHLHDAGVDQSFIDTLPVFNYKAIIGLKDPFDCAVCLCEFEPEDKLRLLPKCSHAFHMECIDTWLLSHSTCPLCRAALLPDFSPESGGYCSPIVLVLESGSDSSREIVVPDRDSVARANSHLGSRFRDEFGSSHIDLSSRKSCEIQERDDSNQERMVGSKEQIVNVKLGKFRNVEGGGRGEGSGSSDSNNNNFDARRCFSMGSFAYVMDETSSLQVPIRTPMKKQSSKKPALAMGAGHRAAMSECDCDSKREFNGFEPFTSRDEIQGIGGGGSGSISLGRSKRESFSISKIWLRAKDEKPNPTAAESSRRAFSFRFPVHQNVAATVGDELKPKSGDGGARRVVSELGIGRLGNEGSDLGFDEEDQSFNSLDSQPKTPSFARKTLLWLVGRQNKVVHSSFAPNV
ncbi:RING-type E3 ubiquitin transferase [Sarracenia purpurea var. burkii]